MPENIPDLGSLESYYQNLSNVGFMDTEGMDYQTEFGENYDIVTILPHALIAENVFLVVRDRLNPKEVSELIDKLATAADKVTGSLSHRNDKLFGSFSVIVNKCQDLSESDEEMLDDLKNNNPSLIAKINQYFTHGPNVIILPLLQWNFDDQPDFNEDGFYITYEMIEKAHPPLRDRMFYGLHRVADQVISGIPTSSDYSITCSNFESMLLKLYDMTTEDVINIEELNYEYLLSSAKEGLLEFVRSYNLEDYGMNNDALFNVCPESDTRLQNCFDKSTKLSADNFYVLCINEAQRLFPPGYNDLVAYLGQ